MFVHGVKDNKSKYEKNHCSRLLALDYWPLAARRTTRTIRVINSMIFTEMFFLVLFRKKNILNAFQ
jgi:hypothetical protein